MLVAALDACVLYRGMLTDLLLRIASQGAFEPVWSNEIHAEWSRNLASRLPEDKITHRRLQMERAFPSAHVALNARLIAKIAGQCRTVAQCKDAHVIATAIDVKATVIVTHNVKDFDAKLLKGYGLAKQRPDAFLLDLLSTRPVQVLAGVKAHRASLRRTNPTVDEYLAEISGPKCDALRFAKALTVHLEDV